MDSFTPPWKRHWAPPSKLELHLLLRLLLPKEEDQESTGVARPLPSSLQGTCAEHLLAVFSEDMSTVALFLELQESRTAQVGRIPLGQGVLWFHCTLVSSQSYSPAWSAGKVIRAQGR